MNIVGTWKIKKVGFFNPEVGFEMKTINEIMSMEETEEVIQAKEMIQTFLKVTEDGMMCISTVVPLEVIEEAKANGEEVPLNDDGTVTIQKMPWKEENGELFYYAGGECEIDGESIDPWVKIELDEDGLLVMTMMAFEKQ